MDGEYFYGAVLDKKGATAKWTCAENEEDGQPANFKLVVRQVLLGHTAKEGEFNVVQVQTTNESGDAVKVPIAVLRVGESRSTMTNLEFPGSPVTFTLIEGSGPVYINGNNMSTYVEHLQEVEDECVDYVEEEQEEEVKDDGKAGNKKRKVSENGPKATNGSSSNDKNNKKHKTG